MAAEDGGVGVRHDPSAFVIPADFWDRTQVAESLRMRDIGSLFQLVQRYAGASQPGIGMRVGLAQSDISKYINGKRIATEFELFERVADGLDLPDRARMLMGLAPRGAVQLPEASRTTVVEPTALPEEPDSVEKIGQRIEHSWRRSRHLIE